MGSLIARRQNRNLDSAVLRGRLLCRQLVLVQVVHIWVNLSVRTYLGHVIFD
jgi:hypothetical protein